MSLAYKSLDIREPAQGLLSRNLKQALEVARNRIMVGIVFVAFIMCVITFRLFSIMVLHNGMDENATAMAGGFCPMGRGNILDRNGEILATSISTSSLYANAKKILDAKVAAKQIRTVLPQLDEKKLVEKLTSGKRFVWLFRHLTPQQQKKILDLGVPGISFMGDQRRIYPHAQLFSHVVGLTDVDNVGLGGVEKTFDQHLRQNGQDLTLSLDLRVQHIVRSSLQEGIARFSATGGTAVVMDLETSEILGMVSAPDFNPNKNVDVRSPDFFNRATLGMYEMGSTMKIANTAMALESGKVHLGSVFDTSAPMNIGKFSITDYRANHGVINVAQIFVHSSNKGSARMALAAGLQHQQNFLKKLGFLEPSRLELPEYGKPLFPKHWREANQMTIAYGYGISLSPLHLLNGVASIVGGGCKKRATLLKLDASAPQTCERVVSPETSKTMLQLMRFVVTDGTSKKANIPGYFVAGKTGTRNLLINGHYRKDRVATSFVGIIGDSQDKPKYMVVVLLEDPKASKETYGFTTAGWNAAPIGGMILGKVASLMSVKPTVEPDHITNPFFRNVSFKSP